MNKIYELLLLKRDSEHIIYDLKKLFSFDGLENFLKTSVIESFDRIQFENINWLIIIRINYNISEFTLQSSKNYGYGLGTGYKEANLDILLEFIEYIERRCKEENIKLKTSENLKNAKLHLELLVDDSIKTKNTDI
ncbi:MAG: hypothetical protein ACFFDF_05310 [Candidatus Odinarchaeota archaeon]